MRDELSYAAAAPFEAARRIADAPAAPLRRLHGHGFVATLRVRADTALTLAPFPGAEVGALRERLAAAVAPLDYQLLNDHLDNPSDEALARWLRARIDLPGPAMMGVRSTAASGAQLLWSGRPCLWRRYAFESAHRLPNVPPGHKCGRMHGHGFAVIIRVDMSAPGAVDAAVVDRIWAPLHAVLDHACLNDIEGLENPTSECLAAWIWRRLRPELPALMRVSIVETSTCGAHFDGASYRIWKDLQIDSAVRLAQAPAADARRRVHGHSYRLRLHLSAPLDAVLGWTMDFGDVKECFAPVFARLDHHPLHEIPGVADQGIAAIAHWVREQAAPLLPPLERIDLYETPGCGVILTWTGAARRSLPLPPQLM